MDKAFEAIWAEKGGRRLTAFHMALSRLRAARRVSESAPRLILVETGIYRLDAARFRIDVDEFDTALAKARAAPNENSAAAWYEQAINLYHGEYLQNMYYDWLMPERQRLRQAYLASLRALAEHHTVHERFTRALNLLQRSLRVDNLQEDIHCQAMRSIHPSVTGLAWHASTRRRAKFCGTNWAWHRSLQPNGYMNAFWRP